MLRLFRLSWRRLCLIYKTTPFWSQCISLSYFLLNAISLHRDETNLSKFSIVSYHQQPHSWDYSLNISAFLLCNWYHYPHVGPFHPWIIAWKLLCVYAACWSLYQSWEKCILRDTPRCVTYLIMAGRAFLVAKEVFHHRECSILTLCEWLNDEKQVFFYFKSTILVNICTRRTGLFNLHWYSPVQFSHQTRIGEPNKQDRGC